MGLQHICFYGKTRISPPKGPHIRTDWDIVSLVWQPFFGSNSHSSLTYTFQKWRDESRGKGGSLLTLIITRTTDDRWVKKSSKCQQREKFSPSGIPKGQGCLLTTLCALVLTDESCLKFLEICIAGYLFFREYHFPFLRTVDYIRWSSRTLTLKEGLGLSAGIKKANHANAYCIHWRGGHDHFYACIYVILCLAT